MAIGLSRNTRQSPTRQASKCVASSYRISWLRPTENAGISTLPPSRRAASRISPNSRSVSSRSRCRRLP